MGVVRLLHILNDSNYATWTLDIQIFSLYVTKKFKVIVSILQSSTRLLPLCVEDYVHSSQKRPECIARGRERG